MGEGIKRANGLVNEGLVSTHLGLKGNPDVAESVMIPMIHGLAENGVDIKSDRFITEVGFINESIRALLFRHLGYKHPMSDFIKHIMVMEKAKTEDVYASFDDKMIDKMNKVLESEKDKKDECNGIKKKC